MDICSGSPMENHSGVDSFTLPKATEEIATGSLTPGWGSALVALSVLVGVAASANALDAKRFYEQLEREHS